MTIIEICQLIIARQQLARSWSTAADMTAAAAATDLRVNYMPLARSIVDKIALLEKTTAQVAAEDAAAAQLLADCVFYSNDVNARIVSGKTLLIATADSYNNDADAARKGRWTLVSVRALFGL